MLFALSQSYNFVVNQTDLARERETILRLLWKELICTRLENWSKNEKLAALKAIFQQRGIKGCWKPASCNFDVTKYREHLSLKCLVQNIVTGVKRSF